MPLSLEIGVDVTARPHDFPANVDSAKITYDHESIHAAVETTAAACRRS